MKPTRPLLEPQVEDLLEFPFEDLSLEERSLILTEMSQREYAELRKVAQAAKAYFQEAPLDLKPNSALQTQLRNRLAQKKSRGLGGKVLHTLKYPVPAWQAVAAMAFLAVAVYFGTQNASLSETPIGPHNIIVDSTHVDSSLRHSYPPNEDSMVHLTSE
ncbi:MAG: hypothetical protein AAF399_26555, partial [Bacteroidota bacterium]